MHPPRTTRDLGTQHGRRFRLDIFIFSTEYLDNHGIIVSAYAGLTERLVDYRRVRSETQASEHHFRLLLRSCLEISLLVALKVIAQPFYLVIGSYDAEHVSGEYALVFGRQSHYPLSALDARYAHPVILPKTRIYKLVAHKRTVGPTSMYA